VSIAATSRIPDSPPVTVWFAWWALVRAIVGLVFIVAVLSLPAFLVAIAAGLPIMRPGVSASLSVPFAPDLLWFRAVDLLAIATFVCCGAGRLRWRMQTRELELRQREAFVAMAGVVTIALVSVPAAVVATVVIAALLRYALNPRSQTRPAHKRWGRWLGVAWAVAVLVSLAVINAVPVAAEPGAACGAESGNAPGLVNSTTSSSGVEEPPLRYPFRAGKYAIPALCTMNRAWFASATVLGVDQTQLPGDAPWRVTLGDIGFALTPAHPNRMATSTTAPFTLAPRATRSVSVLVRFTECRPWMSGHTYTLATVPLRIRAYGHVQTDPVRFAQPVQTTCP
jgi:hypothetical protein